MRRKEEEVKGHSRRLNIDIRMCYQNILCKLERGKGKTLGARGEGELKKRAEKPVKSKNKILAFVMDVGSIILTLLSNEPHNKKVAPRMFRGVQE